MLPVALLRALEGLADRAGFGFVKKQMGPRGPACRHQEGHIGSRAHAVSSLHSAYTTVRRTKNHLRG